MRRFRDSDCVRNVLQFLKWKQVNIEGFVLAAFPRRVKFASTLQWLSCMLQPFCEPNIQQSLTSLHDKSDFKKFGAGA